MSGYVVAPAAADDLDEIWTYIARDDVDAADRWLLKLREQIEILATRPGMGHRRPDLAEDRVILFWPLGSYLILYRAQECVEVIAVVRSRDIPSLIQRRTL